MKTQDKREDSEEKKNLECSVFIIDAEGKELPVCRKMINEALNDAEMMSLGHGLRCYDPETNQRIAAG